MWQAEVDGMVKGESGRLREDVSTKSQAIGFTKSSQRFSQGGGNNTVWKSDEGKGDDTGDKSDGDGHRRQMGGKGIRGGGNGLGIMSGSNRKQAGRGVDGGGMNGEGAGNQLGSKVSRWAEVWEVMARSFVVGICASGGGRDKDAGNKSGGNVVWAGSGNNGEGIGEWGQSWGVLVDWQGLVFEGWQWPAFVSNNFLRTGGTGKDYTCHLEDDRKVKWLFHWLIRAFDLKGEK
ncbi:hypothetical protein EDB89DRAFT_1912711 [Lactarius sanguifluus]|nr:hypothetical protein EDB89DRAFT_1912711 [Lactarius sanguifluus]